MRVITRTGMALAALAALFAITAGFASASGARPFHHSAPPRSFHHTRPPFNPPAPPRRSRPVFVQTDNPAGNQVIAYDQAANGSLTQAGTYNTGGLGGVLEGSVVDHLASQGSLAYDSDNGLLYAVNAGSNTVSVFSVSGDRLSLRQVIGSGGSFPVSIAVERGLVYVLNAEQGGSVQGYRPVFDHLLPIPGSARALGLNASATPQFVNTPGQVAFSPDGSQLIVTTKANGSAIDVFGVRSFGRLTPAPVVNSEPGAVPFAVTFDQGGNLVVSQAGTNSVTSYALHGDGTVTPISSVPTGQAATCWIVRSGNVLYASNAGSGTFSSVLSGSGGQLTFLGNTETDGGTVDAAVSASSPFLYVQAGAAGIVDEFSIGAGGTTTKIGSVTVPGAVGGEGIVAL
jgi:6-phosphogluconolactonase (cycloisomerase 2 family)